MHHLLAFGMAVVLLCGAPALTALERSVAPVGAEVYIISPANGAVVKSPVKVRFGLRAMGVAPAGVNFEGTGHHHLLIDMEELPPMDKPLPASENLVHFGKGQTEATVELAPGVHTLQLLMGNFVHVPHEAPVLSEKITITVK
jgi:hypothetical protein